MGGVYTEADEVASRSSTVRLTGSVLAAVATALVAFNLRPAVTGLGAVLDDVRDALSLSATAAGVLTTLPVLCFAAVGAIAARLARRHGMHRIVAASAVAIAVSLVVRSVTGSAVVFFAVTTVALTGIAIGNVLLPAVVKRHFPDRVGRMTAVYTTALAVGATGAAALTVPIGDLAGGWRAGLFVWGAAAAIAMVPCLLLARGEPRVPPPESDPVADESPRLYRSPLAWALTVYFGSQSLQAYAIFGWLPQIYRDAGFDAATSGLMLAVVPAVGIPVSLALPTLAARRPDQRPYVVVCVVTFAAGFVGLMIAPATAPWLWVVLLGIGGGSFPLALTMIAMRGHTPEVTARLSGFAQSIGYAGAAGGPVAVGALYDATGQWDVPLAMLIVLLVPQLVSGWYAARPVELDGS